MNNRTGEIIEKYRKEKGLTQSELARKLGVSNTAISKWEHGNNLPDITLLEPLSEILGIDKLLLFTSENEAKEETSDRIKTIKKTCIIKNSISILVFLLCLLFSQYISYKVYKHKLEEIKSSQTEIYRFYSKDEEFFVNGYIIFKENESTVIFEELSYQDIRSTKERSKTKSISEDITSAELYMYANNNLIMKKYAKSSKDSPKELKELLVELSSSTKNDMSLYEEDVNNLEIKIRMNKNQIEQEKRIILEVCKEI